MNLQIHIRKMSDAQLRWTFFFLLRIQVFWKQKKRGETTSASPEHVSLMLIIINQHKKG